MGKLVQGVNDLETYCKENNRNQLLTEWDYSKNGLLAPTETYKGSHKKVWWLCPKGHSYESSISSRIINNSGCPYCSGNKVLKGFNDLETTFPNIAQEWHPTLNGELSPQNISGCSGKIVWWLCSQGHSYQARVSDRKNNHNCPICANKKVLVGYNDLETLYPKVAKEWDYEQNYPLTPQDVIGSSKKQVWWCCSANHKWQSTIDSRTHLNRGCPYCWGRIPIKGVNDLETLYPNIAKEWHPTKNQYPPSHYTKASGKKVWWLCPQGHEYNAKILHRTVSKSGCPFCSGSKTEKVVYELLKEWNIYFVREKTFDTSANVKLHYYPYDIFISKYRIIIELDGIQHFTNKYEFFEKSLPHKERVCRDNLKNQYCLEQYIPIPILRIPYTYNSDTDREKIATLVKEFIETRKVPQEILDFYKPYKESIGSNYYDIATKMNEIKWNGYE